MGQLEELDAAECRELLAARQVGRLALATPGGLRIYPVNYALQGDEIVFRTLPYGEMATHAAEAPVAFSVDALDETMRSGWTVLAVGTCRRVEDPDEVRSIRGGGDPDTWASGRRTLYFALPWDELTGRRIHPD